MYGSWEQGFRGRMCVLNVTHNTVPLPPHSPHSGWWRPCAFNKQKAAHGCPGFIWLLCWASPMCFQNGGFSYKGWIREELCRHTSLPSKQNHFWSLQPLRLSQRSFFWLSQWWASLWAWRRNNFQIWNRYKSSQTFQRGTNMLSPVPNTWLTFGTLRIPMSEDSSSLHKPRLQAQQPLTQVVPPIR